MSYKKYWQAYIYFQCKKFGLMSLDFLLRCYVQSLPYFFKLIPAKLRQYLFYKKIRKATLFAAQYWYFRALVCFDTRLLQRSLQLANLYVNYFQVGRVPANAHYQLQGKSIDAIDLAEIFNLAGEQDAAKKLLAQDKNAAADALLKSVKYYFNLGGFVEAQDLLEKYAQTNFNNNFITAILTIEDPRHPQNNSWYNIIPVEPVAEYHFSLPKIFPQRLDNCPKKTVTLPAEQIFQVKDAEIYFGEVIVAQQKYLFLNEPAANPSYDWVAGRWHYLYGSHWQLQHCLVYGEYEKEQIIEAGVLINGRCANNYFHWLIEYLPRLYTIQKDPALNALPLIVSVEMPATCKQSLHLVAGEREIIWLDKKTKLKVQNLYVPSFHTDQPDHMQLPFWKISGLSAAHLNFLRVAAYQQANIVKNPSRKIYLKRSTAIRSLLNIQEIEMVLQAQGFETIYPEKLNFIEQVELFASASCIVSVAGAAFSNLIFSQPGCLVICLLVEQHQDYCIQSNLAKFAGCEFVHITGSYQPSLKTWLSRPNYFHANFVINPAKLDAVLKYFLRPVQSQAQLITEKAP